MTMPAKRPQRSRPSGQNTRMKFGFWFDYDQTYTFIDA
jgi:hypothetical protein